MKLTYFQEYINKYQGGTVTTDNLLDEFDNVVPGMGDNFRPWLYQMGFPLITVQKDGTTLTCSQSMFLLDPQKPLREQYASEYK